MYPFGEKSHAPRRPYRKAFLWAALALAAATAGLSSSFENAADTKFILGYGLPWKIWKTRYFLLHGGAFPNRTLEVRSCKDIDLIYTSHHPILFKGCIDKGLNVDDLLFFEDQVQNLFPPCEGKLLRHFTFESFKGESKPIIEDVPCANSTLVDKISKFHSHELGTGDAANSYFEVHTYMMSGGERSHLNDVLAEKIVVDEVDVGLGTSKMVGPTLTYFLHAGRSAVYYLHAHMDHFISFCLTEEKTWTLIDPVYLDGFDTVREMRKNIGFNIHFLVREQVLGWFVSLALDVFGDPSFFYGTVKQVKPDKFTSSDHLFHPSDSEGEAA